MSGRYERVRYDPTRSTNNQHQQQSRCDHPTSLHWYQKLTLFISSIDRQVNAHDEDDHVSSPIQTTRSRQQIPSSPPPSFHSRASSPTPRNRRVNDPTLADAFDADDSEDEDEPDDRQRLVRQNSEPVTSGSSTGGPAANTPPEPARSSMATAAAAAVAAASNRIFGSGIQSDGVFSNLTAKPERGGASEKEEQPPVRLTLRPKSDAFISR